MDERILETVEISIEKPDKLENFAHDVFRTFEKPFNNSNCENCFLKGVKWSPDGLCLLAASEDFHLRLFELSDVDKPVLDYREGGLVYDFTWYPGMTSAEPATCVFATTSCGSPIHLWDAYTGSLRATYQPINQYDEVHSAYSLCCSPNGKLFCGFKKEIKIFNLNSPGREFESRSLKQGYQTGIISSIIVNPVDSNFYALGSYDKTIGLYDDATGEIQCLLEAHRGGVTHMMFSPDGLFLYTGARKDGSLFCWDLRNPGQTLFTIERTVKTSQRIYFDLTRDGNYLATGSTNGNVDVYDTKKPPSEKSILEKSYYWLAHQDCTNSLSFNPLDSKILATGSGQRHLTVSSSDDESSDDDFTENCIKIWKLAIPR